jgi:hypothetical protein
MITLNEAFEADPDLAHNKKLQFFFVGAGTDLWPGAAPDLYTFVKKYAPERDDLLVPLKQFLEDAVEAGPGFAGWFSEMTEAKKALGI